MGENAPIANSSLSEVLITLSLQEQQLRDQAAKLVELAGAIPSEGGNSADVETANGKAADILNTADTVRQALAEAQMSQQGGGGKPPPHLVAQLQRLQVQVSCAVAQGSAEVGHAEMTTAMACGQTIIRHVIETVREEKTKAQKEAAKEKEKAEDQRPRRSMVCVRVDTPSLPALPALPALPTLTAPMPMLAAIKPFSLTTSAPAPGADVLQLPAVRDATLQLMGASASPAENVGPLEQPFPPVTVPTLSAGMNDPLLILPYQNVTGGTPTPLAPMAGTTSNTTANPMAAPTIAQAKAAAVDEALLMAERLRMVKQALAESTRQKITAMARSMQSAVPEAAPETVKAEAAAPSAKGSTSVITIVTGAPSMVKAVSQAMNLPMPSLAGEGGMGLAALGDLAMPAYAMAMSSWDLMPRAFS